MSLSKDENLNFVQLIEQNKDILETSKKPSAKKKKDEAVALFIEKWKEMYGTQLTQSTLLKKINNLKTRSKSAVSNKAPLKTWHTKLLELTKVYRFYHT